MNIFVIPYVGITLTDSLYTSISILLFAVISQAETLQCLEKKVSIKLEFIGALLLSLAIAIRPAAIWLIAPFIYLLLKLINNRNINALDCLLAVTLGAAPLYIQITLNVTKYGIISIFPAQDLGGDQIKWGIENIKYGTWMGGGSLRNLNSSENLIGVQSTDLGVLWYLYNPIDSIKLLATKLIGAFDFDYLMPYPYQKSHIFVGGFFHFFYNIMAWYIRNTLASL